MTIPNRKDDDMGELVPFPGATLPTTPEPATPKDVEPAGPVLDGEPISEEEYQRSRARRLAGVAVRRLPAQWQTPETARRAGAELAGRVVTAPFRAPGAVARGGAVTGRAWWRWVRVAELRDAAKEAGAAVVVDKFSDVRSLSILRWKITGAVAGVVGTAAGITDLVVGPVPLLLVGAVGTVGLAVAGRRKDGNPGRKAVFPGPRSLAWTMDGDALVEAFRAAKVIGPKDGLMFAARPVRDGDGWAVVVDLPAGRKASSSIAAREALASALGVDEAQLVLERVRGKGGHAGRLAMWVADTDPLAEPPLRSYLEDVPELSIWDGVTIGATARGKTVAVPFCWTSWLVAGLPRYGKSNLLRLFLVAAALDPHTRIYAVDLKDGADFNPLKPVAHRLLIASAEGDETTATLLKLLALLVELETEVLDRYRRFKGMSEVDVPEGKITRALASDPAANMPWLVLAIDECQLGFEELGSDSKDVKELRRVIVDKVSWLVRKGPAAGCTVLLGTQKPDRGSIPTRLRDNIASRAALRLPTQASNDMALGTGKYTAGVDATKFTERHRGAAWLLADDLSGVGASEGVIIRAAKLDLGPTRAAAEAGRDRRAALGILTGDAAGDCPVADVAPERVAQMAAASATVAEVEDADVVGELPEVLALLVDVIGDGERGIVATAELADRIGWESKAVGEALRLAGVAAPTPPKRRMPGYDNPVSVTDVDAVRAAVVAVVDGTAGG